MTTYEAVEKAIEIFIGDDSLSATETEEYLLKLIARIEDLISTIPNND